MEDLNAQAAVCNRLLEEYKHSLQHLIIDARHVVMEEQPDLNIDIPEQDKEVTRLAIERSQEILGYRFTEPVAKFDWMLE